MLCHRGGFANKHPGNIKYHGAKERLQKEYFGLPKDQKWMVTQKLVELVHGWGGRFVERDLQNGRWYEIHDKKAFIKASQVLRENYTREERAAKRARYRKKAKKE